MFALLTLFCNEVSSVVRSKNASPCFALSLIFNAFHFHWWFCSKCWLHKNMFNSSPSMYSLITWLINSGALDTIKHLQETFNDSSLDTNRSQNVTTPYSGTLPMPAMSRLAPWSPKKSDENSCQRRRSPSPRCKAPRVEQSKSQKQHPLNPEDHEDLSVHYEFMWVNHFPLRLIDWT